MKAETVFDVCWDAYKTCWEEAFVKGHVHALDASAFKEHRWKPAVKPRAEDFLADFQLAGEAVLARKDAHSRMILFRLYYCGQAEYEAARQLLGLSENGWVRWTEEIRRLVGGELERRGVWPVSRYFGRE